MQDALRRRDRQRDQEEAQRPIAGLMDRLGDRPRAELVGGGLIGNPQPAAPPPRRRRSSPATIARTVREGMA
jgi:hypothetical protein